MQVFYKACNFLVFFCDIVTMCVTIHKKILVGKKLANMVNRELFAKLFLLQYSKKMYLAHTLTVVAYSPSFSSPTAFTCMVHQNFPCQNFPVYHMCLHVYV